MVGNYAHGHINLLVLAIFKARQFANLLDDGLEDVGIVVRVLALNSTHQSLKAHARINHIHAQWHE